MTQHGEHKHMLTFSLVMVRNQAVPFVYKFGIMLLAHRGTLVHACVVNFYTLILIVSSCSQAGPLYKSLLSPIVELVTEVT